MLPLLLHFSYPPLVTGWACLGASYYNFRLVYYYIATAIFLEMILLNCFLSVTARISSVIVADLFAYFLVFIMVVLHTCKVESFEAFFGAGLEDFFLKMHVDFGFLLGALKAAFFSSYLSLFFEHLLSFFGMHS